MIRATVTNHPRLVAAIAACIAMLAGIVLAGGLADGRSEVEARQPGSELTLARWQVELPRAASAWSGNPYSEYDGDAMVGTLMRIESTDVESAAIDPRVIRAAVLTNEGTWRTIAEDAGSAWLHRDGDFLDELHPGLPEQVLLAWTLPKSIQPDDVRTLRVTFHDEYEHESIQGTSWQVDDRRIRVELPVTAGAAPVAPEVDGDA